MKKAVIIYGPPGSGKGTQAELLARKFGLIHFDTGRFIESVVHSPQANNDPILKREQELFDTGKLCTPKWVFHITQEAVRNIAQSGSGIIFSGSPRTEFEAFGSKGKKGLIHLLKNLYGKENIAVIRLKVSDKSSLKRNSGRLVCSVCGLPVLAASKKKQCAFCAGPMRKRIFDNPKLIKIRLKEYEERTFPILQGVKKMNIRVIEINGEPLPFKVFEEIKKKLGGKRRK